MMMRVGLNALVVLCLFALAGCSIAPRQEGMGETPQDERPVAERPLQGEGRVPKVVVRLVREANAASNAGEHEQAAVHLERAIRIAPRNAALWQNLAVVRFRQSRFVQAESLALKSNTLTTDSELKRQNWALIAEARARAGNQAGARQAAEQAERFEGGSRWR